jgi:hypothetical protein
MKSALLALSAASVCLAGCATMKVSKTEVASGATNPKAIYIRSYVADESNFVGHQANSKGERPIRHSLAPAEFSAALKQELEKMAPARVLEDDEVPTTGWLVESDIQYADGGNLIDRGSPLGHVGIGRSKMRIHVRVTDIGGRHSGGDGKKDVAGSVARTTSGAHGPVIYEFDLEGGSRASGILGSIYAPGVGNAAPFDYKNAAERVLMALSVDPHLYGVRTSPVIR